MTDVTCDNAPNDTDAHTSEATSGEDHDVIEGVLAEEHQRTLRWLEDQFPEWQVEVTHATSWMEDDLKPIWIARREGHHPQAELSAAKLHTRLTEYLERAERRQAMSN